MTEHTIYTDFVEIKKATYYEDVKDFIKVGVEKYINDYEDSKGNPKEYCMIVAHRIWKSLFTTAGSHFYPNWKAIKTDFREKHQEFIVAVERRKGIEKSEDEKKKKSAMDVAKRKKELVAKKKK